MMPVAVPPRVYLFRAFYEWIVDEGFTPYLQVDASYPTVRVPEPAVQQGMIVLNIAPLVVDAFAIKKNGFEFNALFRGYSHALYIPHGSVLALYAKENRAMMLATSLWWKDEALPPPERNEGFTVL